MFCSAQFGGFMHRFLLLSLFLLTFTLPAFAVTPDAGHEPSEPTMGTSSGAEEEDMDAGDEDMGSDEGGESEEE
jgi:hypothetical protein